MSAYKENMLQQCSLQVITWIRVAMAIPDRKNVNAETVQLKILTFSIDLPFSLGTDEQRDCSSPVDDTENLNINKPNKTKISLLPISI